MGIRFHSSVLVTNNLDEMKEFYTSVLGQDIQHDFGICVIFEHGLTIWTQCEQYPLNKALGKSAEGGRSMEICFETDEFAAKAEVMKRNGVRLVHDVVEEQWGQHTIRFYDPDGNIITLGESMPCFCRRLFRSGLNVAEIAKKTSISAKTVKEYLS